MVLLYMLHYIISSLPTTYKKKLLECGAVENCCAPRHTTTHCTEVLEITQQAAALITLFSCGVNFVSGFRIARYTATFEMAPHQCTSFSYGYWRKYQHECGSHHQLAL